MSQWEFPGKVSAVRRATISETGHCRRRRLAAVDTSEVSWDEVADHVRGLSQAVLTRTAESAAKRAILDEGDTVSTAALIAALCALRGIRHTTGFGRLPAKACGPQPRPPPAGALGANSTQVRNPDRRAGRLRAPG